MRIAAIRGCNLASIDGEFEVALEDGPMAGAGVFAISGPVGAGKTTILDAMCLALFDRTPRLARGSHRLRLVDGVDEIGVTDPRSLLRRGATEGRAEVDFVGRNGRRWRATWSVRRARDRVDGRLQAQTMELRDLAGGTVVQGNKTEVLARIEAELGLSWDQFCRSVLLAQGEFAAFLQAKPQERAELLERMTGTAVYAQIGRTCHERAGEEQRALDALESRRGGIASLDATERAGLQERLKELQREQQALDARRAACAREVDRHEARARRLDGVRAAAERLAVAERGHAVAAPLREALATLVRLAPLRPLLDAADRARGAVRELAERVEAARGAQREAAAAAESARTEREDGVRQLAQVEAERARIAGELRRARAVDVQRAQAERTLAEADRAQEAAIEAARGRRSVVEDLEQRVAGQQALLAEARRRLESVSGGGAGGADRAGLVAEWPRWQAELARHERVATALLQAGRERVQGERERARLREMVSAAEARLADRRRRTSEAEETLREALAALGTDPAEARRERARREQAGEQLSSLQGLVGRLSDQREALDEAAGARTSAARARIAAEAARHAARAEGASVASALEEAASTLRRLEATEDLSARRSELLVDGEPCPLCGAAEHPYAHAVAHALSAVVADQRQRVAALGARQRELAGEEQRQLAFEAEASRREGEAVERMGRAEAAIAEIERQWTEAVERLLALDGEAGDVPERPEPEVAEVLASLLEANTARIARIARCESALSDARAALDEQRVAERAADHEVRELRVALATGEVALNGLGERIAELDSERGRIVETLAPVLDGQPRWREELAADPAAFARACEAAVSQLRQWGDQARACEVALDDLGRKLEVARALVDEAARDERVRRAEREAAAATVDELADARAALLGGRAVDEVEQELETALEHARHALSLADTALRAAQEGHAEQMAACRECEGSAVRASEEAARAEEALATGLAEVGVSESEARAGLRPESSGLIAERAADWEQAARARLAEVDEALIAARSELRALEASERVEEAVTGNRSVDEAREELDLLRAADEALGEARLEAVARLRADDEAHAQLVDLQPRIERQRKRADLWRDMADLIGSHDGSRFRVFAQGLTLDALVAHANVHLRDLAPRYRLARVPGQDLDLQIVDRDLAHDVRGVNSLSGGETFLVSLALALGLSSLASHDVRIGSLFVDEGFGSLDPDTLEVALGTLDALQATGRQVGLVSHVPGLAERIGVRIEVVPTSAGRSEVRIVA